MTPVRLAVFARYIQRSELLAPKQPEGWEPELGSKVEGDWRNLDSKQLHTYQGTLVRFEQPQRMGYDASIGELAVPRVGNSEQRVLRSSLRPVGNEGGDKTPERFGNFKIGETLINPTDEAKERLHRKFEAYPDSCGERCSLCLDRLYGDETIVPGAERLHAHCAEQLNRREAERIRERVIVTPRATCLCGATIFRPFDIACDDGGTRVGCGECYVKQQAGSAKPKPANPEPERGSSTASWPETFESPTWSEP